MDTENEQSIKQEWEMQTRSHAIRQVSTPNDLLSFFQNAKGGTSDLINTWNS